MRVTLEQLDTVKRAMQRRERKVEHIAKLIRDFEAKVQENRELLTFYTKERNHFTQLYDELRAMRVDRS